MIRGLFFLYKIFLFSYKLTTYFTAIFPVRGTMLRVESFNIKNKILGYGH